MPLTELDKDCIEDYLKDNISMKLWPNHIVKKLSEERPALFYALTQLIIMKDIINSILNGKDWK